jgi:hypothetical protein
MAQDLGRSAKGERADRPKRARREPQRSEVALDDRHARVTHPTNQATKPLGPHGIELDRHHLDFVLGEFEGDRSKSRADLDDELSAAEISLVDQAPGALGTDEILTKTATPLVPVCPRFGGHGGSLP